MFFQETFPKRKVFISIAVAANTSAGAVRRISGYSCWFPWFYLYCNNIYLPVYVTYNTLYSSGCIYTTMIPENFTKISINKLLWKTKKIYICLSHFMVTSFLQMKVQISLYFHKPKVSPITNFMKHLEVKFK